MRVNVDHHAFWARVRDGVEREHTPHGDRCERGRTSAALEGFQL